MTRLPCTECGCGTIRVATPEDAFGLMALADRVGSDARYFVVTGFDPITGAELLKASLADSASSNNSKVFVAAKDDVVVGLALCRRHPAPGRDGVAQLDLAVDRGFRRQRFGHALVQHVIGWSRASGIHRIQIAVVSDNRTAISLYKKNGFEIEGTLRRSFKIDREFHDVYVMARLLCD